MKILKTLFFTVLFGIGFAGCQKKHGDIAAPTRTTTETKGEAAKALEGALEKVKVAPNFENYTDLGLAYAKLNFHLDALDAFKMSGKLKANSEVAANNMCSQYMELLEWKNAKIQCEIALRFNPNFEVPANNLKIIEAAIAKLKDEAAVIQKSLATAKGAELVDVQLDLGKKYFDLQDYAEATRVWSKIPKSSAKYSYVLNNLAAVNIMNRKFEAAKKLLAEAEKLDPTNPLVQNNKGWLKKESERGAN